MGGSYQFHENFRRLLPPTSLLPKLKRKLRSWSPAVTAPGAFAPQVMQAIIARWCRSIELDHTFPKYNPNPEDMEMLHSIRDAVLELLADVGLGFDGDGDRCGVVDNTE